MRNTFERTRLCLLALSFMAVVTPGVVRADDTVVMLPPSDANGAPCAGAKSGILQWDGLTPIRCVPGFHGDLQTGYVGIGTENPVTNLQVVGRAQFGTTAIGTFADPSEAVQIVGDPHTPVSLAIWQPGIAAGLIGTKADDTNFYITNDWSAPGVGAEDYSITLTKEGYVGIKTKTPFMPLDVQWDVSNSVKNNDWGAGQIIVNGATDTNKRMALGFDTSANVGFIQPYINGTGYNNLLLNPAGGNVGIGKLSPAFALDVAGQARFTGGYTTSDRRWKKNIKPLAGALSTLVKLQGVSYDWRRDEFPDMHFADGKQIGFIAQDVEKVLPEIVETDKDGYKNVSYQSVVPVLVEAVKELKADDDNLRAEIDAMKERNH